MDQNFVLQNNRWALLWGLLCFKEGDILTRKGKEA